MILITNLPSLQWEDIIKLGSKHNFYLRKHLLNWPLPSTQRIFITDFFPPLTSHPCILRHNKGPVTKDGWTCFKICQNFEFLYIIAVAVIVAFLPTFFWNQLSFFLHSETFYYSRRSRDPSSANCSSARLSSRSGGRRRRVGVGGGRRRHGAAAAWAG